MYMVNTSLRYYQFFSGPLTVIQSSEIQVSLLTTPVYILFGVVLCYILSFKKHVCKQTHFRTLYCAKFYILAKLSILTNERNVSFLKHIFKEICQSNLTVAFVRNEERLSHIVKTCAHMRELKNAPSEANIWVSPSFSLAFCVVPKVGCTYWKRTLRWVNTLFAGCI